MKKNYEDIELKKISPTLKLFIIYLLFVAIIMSLFTDSAKAFFSDLPDDIHEEIYIKLNKKGKENYKLISKSFYKRNLIHELTNKKFLSLLRGEDIVNICEIENYNSQGVKIINDNFRSFFSKKSGFLSLLKETSCIVGPSVGLLTLSTFLLYYSYHYEQPAPALTAYGKLLNENPEQAQKHLIMCQEEKEKAQMACYNDLMLRRSFVSDQQQTHFVGRSGHIRRVDTDCSFSNTCSKTHIIWPSYWSYFIPSVSFFLGSLTLTGESLKSLATSVAFHDTEFGNIHFYDLYLAYRTYYLLKFNSIYFSKNR